MLLFINRCLREPQAPVFRIICLAEGRVGVITLLNRCLREPQAPVLRIICLAEGGACRDPFSPLLRASSAYRGAEVYSRDGQKAIYSPNNNGNSRNNRSTSAADVPSYTPRMRLLVSNKMKVPLCKKPPGAVLSTAAKER